MKDFTASCQRAGALVVLTVKEENPLILPCFNMARFIIPSYRGLVSRAPDRLQSLML